MGHNVNTAQAEAWNGYEGAQWARSQERWDAVNDGFNQPLLDAAAISESDSVLDVGCGTGRTSRLAARRAGLGRALGLDLSGPMLGKARESALRERVENVSFVQGDAQVHPLQAEGFDAVISRYGMTFFTDPVAAFANLHRALRPGGRLAFICAAEAEANEWLEALASLKGILPLGGFGKPGGPGMFSLTDPDHVRSLLGAAWVRPCRRAAHRGTGEVGRRRGRRGGVPAGLRPGTPPARPGDPARAGRGAPGADGRPPAP